MLDTVDDAAAAVRDAQGGVAHVFGTVAEERLGKPFFRRRVGLSFRGHFPDKYIAFFYLGA